MARSRDWQRLATRLRNRRVHEMGYKSKVALYKAHDVPAALQRIISDIENAKRDNYDADTLARIERVYEWLPGSIGAVLNGGEPMPAEDDVVTSDLPERAETPDQKRKRLKGLVEGLPADQLDRVRRYLTEILTEER